MLKEEQIPKTIRRIRLEQQLTQQDVASAMGVTKGYISRIENADSAPPVATLISLAKALGVEFNSLFEENTKQTIVTFTPGDQRFPMGKEGELDYAHLAIKFPDRKFEPYIITVSHGEKLSKTMPYKRQEFWFVVKGEFEVMVDDQTFSIKSGDSIYLNSKYKYSGQCTSKDGGQVLAVIWNIPDDDKNLPE